ncbi:hydrogenase expression/formation protein HypE [Grimontia hollisae]|uniref:Hydrogenase isoenzymes formation protein hypE n=1 Tax=Grimontia hollisae TaxID=673 RepID=A0A377HMZ4_GRIHO|nr:hydrogenase expression/formation protein HypE [Grimontia hollisae]MDF2186290.1 hydrogenase expression/formation protein HypE [Grimontia hollisae]STO57474.1 Hydrogenase isoenzymes formation protein hypE [Grimontia hollisae]
MSLPRHVDIDGNIERITLAHGSGGIAMRELVEKEIVAVFDNPHLAPLEDQARLGLADITKLGDRLAMTTDSFVVDPLEFPGGDIGTLAVNGTVNDLAMGGATPLYLTCGLILEEGLPLEVLRRILASMKQAADKAGVAIVSGDTKVVHKGAADKLFINTSGIGVVPPKIDVGANHAQPGDVVIVNGWVGDHGATIMASRGDLSLDTQIQSDCRTLYPEVKALLDVAPVHCLRDATRGGIATVLNEFAESSNVRIVLDHGAIPVRKEVRGVCELLGLDPLYLANEGKFVAIVPAECADSAIQALRRFPGAETTAVIGRIETTGDQRQGAGVSMKTAFGSERMIDMLTGDQLPRIC